MSLPNEFTVYGSEEMLKPLILQLLAQHYDQGESQEIGNSAYREPLSPNFKDFLQITLHWRGVTETTAKNHRVEKSIRLKDVDPKTVSLAYLKQLGTKVLTKFNNLNFRTGHIKAKYSKWADGFQVWGYFESEMEGYKIIEAMGDIIGKPIDRGLLRFEKRADASDVFSPNGDLIQLASNTVRSKAKAPIALMKFHAATIMFPYIQHTELLCSISGYVIRDLKFLDAYKD